MGNGLPLNSRGNGAGGCNYCHDQDALDPPTIRTNSDLHHGTGLGADSTKCEWCHDFGMPLDMQIRECQDCHGPDSLHNIQADSTNAGNIGTIVIGGEDAGYGHVGRDAGIGDSDCWGCHGFSPSPSPDPGPPPGDHDLYFVSGTEAGCRACHDSDIPDRHHVLYDTTIPFLTNVPYGAPGESYYCLSCHGTDLMVQRDCLVCHEAPEVIGVTLDIKPGSYPNPINRKSRGVIPVAILGSGEYDVTDIDISTLVLSGTVSPLRWSFQGGLEGYDDLALKFSAADLRAALGDLEPGMMYEVCINGTFMNGTPFLGCDSVVVVPGK
jgi:hypothetical protein